MQTPDSANVPGGPPAAPRTFMRYAFYKASPEWRRLPAEERHASKREFASAVAAVSEMVRLKTFSLAGVRGDADFLLWMHAPGVEEIQAAGVRLNATHLGRHSAVPYSYLAITRPSPYMSHPSARPKEAELEDPKFLFVYPFVKSREWYAQPQTWRRAMMMEHLAVSSKFPSVRINTGYSYGIDDQEHIVAFETDNAADFLDLVMALRDSQQSSYTVRDTPAFTCVAADIHAALDAIAG